MAPPLRVVSVPFPHQIDLVSVVGTDGVLFADDTQQLAGRGVAATLPLPGGLDDAAAVAEVGRWLASLPHAGGGPPVRAVGALPFDREAPGALLVPQLAVVREAGGRQWLTAVGTDPDPDAAVRAVVAAGAPGAPGEPDRTGGTGASAGTGTGTLAPRTEPQAYLDAVAAVTDAIAAGSVRKVVLGRRVDARFDHPIALGRALQRLMANEPLCTTFAMPIEGGAHFVGASPELLVERSGTTVRCHPLAGTVGLDQDRGGHGDTDDGPVARFLRSPKEQAEHALVVQEIARQLRPLCTTLDVPDRPTLVRLRFLAHLQTRIEGTLRAGGPAGGDAAGDTDARPPTALELLADLHPTPAVGGVPRDEAVRLIAKLEPFPRRYWAGPVGWVDARGDGRWMIGLRSATVGGATAQLWAGAGIVAGSDPQAELEETTVKLSPVLDALGLTPS